MKTKEMNLENVENVEKVENVDDVHAADVAAEAVDVAEAIDSAFNTGYEFEVEGDFEDEQVKLAIDSERTVAVVPFYRKLVKGIKTMDGRPLYNHFAYTRESVAGKVHEIFAYFDPADKGGYGLFDIIFSVCKTAKLVVTEHCTSDGNGGTRTYMSYEIFSTNVEGSVYSCPVRLHGKSDKAYLEIIIKNENRLTE